MRTAVESRKASRVSSLRLTGCKVLGRGYFATVMACGPDEVVKVCIAEYRPKKHCQDAWPIWARFCMLHPDLPGVIRIRSMEVDRGLCTTYMERCEPLTRRDKARIDFTAWIRDPYQLGTRHPDFAETGDALSSWLVTEYPGVFFSVDAHSKNIMKGRDGRLVLTDPLVFGRATTPARVSTAFKTLT